MRIPVITPVKNTAGTVRSIAKNQNFKGLWGEKQVQIKDTVRWTNTWLADEGEYEEITRQTYYPFADETDEEIKNTVEAAISNTESLNKKCEDEDFPDYLVSKHYEFIPIVMPRLAITEAQYKAYINPVKMTEDEKIKMIESEILKRKFKL